MTTSRKPLRVPFIVDGIKEAISGFQNLDKELTDLGKSSDKALQPIKDLPEEIQASAKAAEGGLRSLGVRSERTADAQVKSVERVLKMLDEQREAGTITASDYSKAWEKAQGKIERIQKSIGQVIETAAERAEKAMSSLGITSEASAERQKQAILADYRAIEQSGTATPAEIARAWDAAQSKIQALQNQTTRVVETAADKARLAGEEAARRLGVTTAREAEKQKREYREAYDAIARSGNATTEDLEAAWREMTRGVESITDRMARQVESRWKRMAREMGLSLRDISSRASLGVGAAGAGLGYSLLGGAEKAVRVQNQSTMSGVTANWSGGDMRNWPPR